MHIKTCPFCGGEADIWETDSTTHPYQVVCQTCYCGTDKCVSEEEAIKRWNTRKPIDKAVEEMKSDLERWRESGKEFNDAKELGVACGFEYAIEIIRKGGLAE